MIVGPSGGGKELVARTLHAMSSRADGPFVVINAAAMQLLDANWSPGRRLRLIGVGVSGLLDEAGYQLDLFDDHDQRAIRLATALDEIRERFGRDAIVRASMLDRPLRPPREPRDSD